MTHWPSMTFERIGYCFNSAEILESHSIFVFIQGVKECIIFLDGEVGLPFVESWYFHKYKTKIFPDYSLLQTWGKIDDYYLGIRLRKIILVREFGSVFLKETYFLAFTGLIICLPNYNFHNPIIISFSFYFFLTFSRGSVSKYSGLNLTNQKSC